MSSIAVLPFVIDIECSLIPLARKRRITREVPWRIKSQTLVLLKIGKRRRGPTKVPSRHRETTFSFLLAGNYVGMADVCPYIDARHASEAAMSARSILPATGAALMLCACALAPSAQAGDFLSSLFDAFGVRPPGPITLPFSNRQADPPRARAGSGGQAWCVRTCDGRHFPAQGPDRQSRAASCNSFCPAATTELVYGSDIDNAATEDGKPYSELPNAFRYRSEIVSGCTCNGKDQVGLAPVSIESDPTLRRGDLIAGEGGLVVSGRGSDKHAAANFSPAPEAARARYRHVPVVAAE
jgi:hypothetical protein